MMSQTTTAITSPTSDRQSTVEKRKTFQCGGHYRPDSEYSPLHKQLDTAPQKTSIEEIAPQNFDDSVLASFALEYREHATATAQKTLTAGKSATATVLQMAGWIQEMVRFVQSK